MVFALFFNTPRGRRNGGTVPGAADNLSACALVVAMCRFLDAEPRPHPGGHRGPFRLFRQRGGRTARLPALRKCHLDELRRLDVRLLNYETVAHPEITILTTDVAGVKNSTEMVRSLAVAAQRAGVPYKVKPSPTGAGGSDAGPFSQAGLHAANLLPFRLPGSSSPLYHQPADRPEVPSLEPLLNVLKLTWSGLRRRGVGAGAKQGSRASLLTGKCRPRTRACSDGVRRVPCCPSVRPFDARAGALPVGPAPPSRRRLKRCVLPSSLPSRACRAPSTPCFGRGCRGSRLSLRRVWPPAMPSGTMERGPPGPRLRASLASRASGMRAAAPRQSGVTPVCPLLATALAFFDSLLAPRLPPNRFCCIVVSKRPNRSILPMKWTTLRHNGVAFPPPYEYRGLTVRIADEQVTLGPRPRRC